MMETEKERNSIFKNFFITFFPNEIMNACTETVGAQTNHKYNGPKKQRQTHNLIAFT